MPGRLHLSPNDASLKVMVAPPRLNLRRAASYNAQDRGPLSSSSSRFSFNHLLFSPPPSPGLPALVPRRKRSASIKVLVARPPRPFRLLAYLLMLFFSFYTLGIALRYKNTMAAMPAIWPYFTAQQEFEMVGQDALPDFPTPLLVTDNQGQSRWTVFVPQDYDFPLSLEQYSEMNAQCREVATLSRGEHGRATSQSEPNILSYDATDDYFVDVFEAEKSNLLPAALKSETVKVPGQFVGVDEESMFGKPVCETSMTFVLESADAGLGNTLMLLWTFYGLAKEQERAFFIDDTRWAYGDWKAIFQPPPIPDCQPPPRHHIIPCPAQARHLAVSSTTAKEIFPAILAKHRRIAEIENEVQDFHKLARTGYEALFHLNKDDKPYVRKRIDEFIRKGQSEGGLTKSMPVVSYHIRRGDRHPFEFQYRDTYIPNEVFIQRAEVLVEEFYNATQNSWTHHREAVTLLASDDPTILHLPEFSGSLAAQDRIRLASKEAVRQAKLQEDPNALRRFVDEAFGWEGGFFAPMFWNLGIDRKNNGANAPSGVQVKDVNEEARHHAPPSATTLQLRSLIGRAYIMDLAVLAGASDYTVCAVSALGCRLLGVMMGWEAIEKGRWANVDGEYGWTGIQW
ncbi:hypothetical protein B0I35DRAFT_473341 [Stachybotrys elegans]|uniref:Uncharacterized protein n=1 Tax=Stachybotrys elegans TaxID=80388 RepID=A0A8K0T4G4_9HYPO|nr:hypothetical protein B0I35DRAFT_473341 [Stachybotrys elegans]